MVKVWLILFRSIECFLFKAKLLSQVRHPNIVSYKESFQGDDGFLYIVMAFCEGGDMYTRLKAQEGKYLEERQIVEWFVQIAMALQVRYKSNTAQLLQLQETIH